ncbi:hypothetical protein [Paenibacillus baekrokdamisoli]|nr:hypothetical protein [Paenibacillus baekrokdamisoli]
MKETKGINVWVGLNFIRLLRVYFVKIADLISMMSFLVEKT